MKHPVITAVVWSVCVVLIALILNSLLAAGKAISEVWQARRRDW